MGTRTVFDRWTWGFNTATSSYANYPVTLTATVNGVSESLYTNDFLTLTQNGTTNNYQVVAGDSGGPDFIYNGTTKAWELAGLNQVMFSNNGSAPFASGMVQLDTYLPQINAIMAPANDGPAMPDWAMGLLAVSLVAIAAVKKGRAQSPAEQGRRARADAHCFATGS